MSALQGWEIDWRALMDSSRPSCRNIMTVPSLDMGAEVRSLSGKMDVGGIRPENATTAPALQRPDATQSKAIHG